MAKDGESLVPLLPATATSRHNQNPSDIKELVLYLCTSLTNDQFQSILLSSRFALDIREQIQDRDFLALYTAIKNLLVDDDKARSCLRLMLERVQYDMSDLEWLPPAPVFREGSAPDRYRKLDMLLAMAVMITSMSDSDYTRFRGQLVRGERGNLLNDISSDTIESRCSLVQILFQRNYFATDDLQNVFDWLDDSHCSYPEQLVQYCNRYGMAVPRDRKFRKSFKRNCRVNKCCLLILIIVLIVSVVICFIVSAVSVSLTLMIYDKFNKANENNGQYPVGGNDTVWVGECFNPNFIDHVDVEAVNNASNNTTIYLVKEKSVSTEIVHRETKTVLSLSHVTENVRPFDVPYYDSDNSTLYTADEGGIVNYTVSLINYNTERASCALKLVVFDSEIDFITYTQLSSSSSYMDPNDVPPNSYTSTSCFGANGTHSFSFELYNNAFFYFALSRVANITFYTSASGSISKYVLSDIRSSCTLITDGRPCSFQIQQTTSIENERWCLFAKSNQVPLGDVKLTVTPRSYKKYKREFMIPAAVLGFTAMLLLYYAMLLCIFYCYTKN